MKRPALVLVSLLATTLFLNSNGFAQKCLLFGQVTDAETEEAIPGARVILEEIGSGAIANWEGKYEVMGVRKGNYTLKIESEGFYTETLSEFQVRGKFMEENFSLKRIPCIPRKDPVLVQAELVLPDGDTIDPKSAAEGIKVEIRFQGRWGDQFKLFQTRGFNSKEVIFNIFRSEKVDCEPETPFPDPYYEVKMQAKVVMPETGEYQFQLRSDDIGKEQVLKRVLVQTLR